jgi:hypothetical protein
MRRIGLAVVVALSLVLAPNADEAQQVGRARIAMLETSASDPARVAWWDAFRQKMREPLNLKIPPSVLGRADQIIDP